MTATTITKTKEVKESRDLLIGNWSQYVDFRMMTFLCCFFLALPNVASAFNLNRFKLLITSAHE